MFPRSVVARRVLSVAQLSFVHLVEMTLMPGVTISGCLERSLGTPLDENSVRPLDCVPAPTATTQSGSANGLMVGCSGPSFPAAKKTAIPASWAAFVASWIGVPGSQPFVGLPVRSEQL